MSQKPSLRELVNLNELQSIQDSLANTVGTASVIFSPEGEPLTQISNPTGFCSLIQSTEEGKRRCFLSFMEMCQKARELKEPSIHYCFAHSGHFVAPIIINGEHKGTMFAGQFIPQKFSTEQLKALEKIAVEINVDPTLLVEEAKKMRVVEEDQVWNYSSLLFQIVVVITRLGAQADELNRAKDGLQTAHNGLEIRVQERTAELARANEELKQDITERKHLMMELGNSNMFLESVIENIPDAVYLKDSQYRFSLVNQAYCDLFEVKKEEIKQLQKSIKNNIFLIDAELKAKQKGMGKAANLYLFGVLFGLDNRINSFITRDDIIYSIKKNLRKNTELNIELFNKGIDFIKSKNI